MTTKHLLIMVSGAGPASDVGQLITLARDAEWTTAVIATPSALTFIDVPAVEQSTGFPVRDGFHHDMHRANRTLPSVDALVIAPATYNTINKLASGVADNYALTSAAELIGRGVPTIVVPFVNTALAERAPFRRSIAQLRDEGIRVFLGPDDHWQPHPPGTGTHQQQSFPWQATFQLTSRQVG